MKKYAFYEKTSPRHKSCKNSQRTQIWRFEGIWMNLVVENSNTSTFEKNWFFGKIRQFGDFEGVPDVRITRWSLEIFEIRKCKSWTFIWWVCGVIWTNRTELGTQWVALENFVWILEFLAGFGLHLNMSFRNFDFWSEIKLISKKHPWT